MTRLGATEPAALRKVNKTLSLEVIRERGPVSRADLSRILGLTRSTMSLIIEDLVADGLVRPAGIGSTGTGRKPLLYECNPDAGYVIGLDIGGTNIKCQFADFLGQSLHSEHWQTYKVASSAEFIARLVEQLRDIISFRGFDPQRMRGLGVATPGIVDPDRGMVLGASPNLPQWYELPLGPILAREFGVPVLIDNDVNAALIGEHVWGTGRGKDNLAFIVVSTGIGGALMFGGQVYRGRNFAAGEVGYWLTDAAQTTHDWKPKGALETNFSATAVAAKGTQILGRTATAKDVFDAARAGHAEALQMVRELAEHLGLVATNIATLLDVDRIIFGGGVMLSSDMLIPRIAEIVKRHAIQVPEIVASSLSDEAGVLGAVQLALTAAIPEARLQLGGNRM